MYTQFSANYHSPFYVFIDHVNLYLLLFTVSSKVVFCCYLDCVCLSCCALTFIWMVLASVYRFLILALCPLKFSCSGIIHTSILEYLHFHVPPLNALTW